MYTQCPDCSTAFRVTAEVLKQAAGKVRCGGCGIAFNALEYLSEQVPQQQPATKEADARLPELTPELRQPSERTPMAISAEQSAALLKTLDELAGSDIRIEDTGVEWRVVDDDADDGLTVGDPAVALDVDEILDESPTPVDQFLTQTPNQVEASEIFEESANAPAQTPVEELRFDDNTPLPDDFDLDDEASYAAVTPEAEASDGETQAEFALQTEHPRDVDESPVDIALGDPGEWADILGEFVKPPEPYVPPLDAELTALEEVLPDDGSDGEEIETPPDMDTQFALQAEAMGIDLSGVHTATKEQLEEQGPDDDVDEAPISAEPESADEPEEIPERDDSDDAAGLELRGETGEAQELELLDATGATPELELANESGAEPLLEEETDEEPDERPDEEPDTPLQLDEDIGAEPLLEDETDEEPDAEPETSLELGEEEATRHHEFDEEEDADEAPLEFGSIEKAMAELEEQSDVFDKDFFDDGSADEFEEASVEEDDIVLEGEPPSREEPQHVVPELSEEEQTLNMLIDQDLLSMAIEDEDGFVSTIVAGGKDAEEALEETSKPFHTEDAAGFESIVMEGEFVRTALGQEKRKADIAAAAELAEQARLAREAEARRDGGGRKRGMAAAAVILVLLLVVQVLHQSREALATIPAFNDAVGPIYRAIGMPLSPAWDVTGWRFEARRDLLDEEADTLTVISRIGNTSAKALPYPLISISLTDRFEETIGSKTLNPGDYLTDDLDASKLVQPGNNFTAVMMIESPSEEATGYKLQACYRQPDAQLRCHIPNFK